MSNLPEEFSGPFNWDAFAAIELVKPELLDALIALLESSEPIDWEVREWIAAGLRRGKHKHCAPGQISLKLIGAQRAVKNSSGAKVEQLKKKYADGEGVQRIMDENGLNQTPAIEKIQVDEESKLDRDTADKRKSRASYLHKAYNYYIEAKDWVAGLEKRPFYIQDRDNWRDDPQLLEWYHLFKTSICFN